MVVNLQRIADDDLILLIRQQKKDGAVALYDTYAKAIFLAIIRIIPQPEIAENILEQTLLTVWQSVDTYSAKNEKLLGWMMQIARKLAREQV
ncbi:RNA polymerase sigma factor [Mucilaginibacter sp. FT3.2]|uniref:RNA polymerase sigma factor n=1 Tax=Mucilaginibacter sp. FT3.2 TaxID=2723090 RepID=UPI0016177562|nr:sigma factor [Mucilaginibacter sp. FT3.2]MBB6232441.1 DNA-directed RNA polymerase specialized sigma24 family protein [Mucilaginibacter sp. FT3.2]